MKLILSTKKDWLSFFLLFSVAYLIKASALFFGNKFFLVFLIWFVIIFSIGYLLSVVIKPNFYLSTSISFLSLITIIFLQNTTDYNESLIRLIEFIYYRILMLFFFFTFLYRAAFYMTKYNQLEIITNKFYPSITKISLSLISVVISFFLLIGGFAGGIGYDPNASILIISGLILFSAGFLFLIVSTMTYITKVKKKKTNG